jgi:hypothetical protein
MVADLEAALKLYLGPLDGQLLQQADDADARRAFVLVGTDTVVELAKPVGAGTALHDDLERNGQLPHSVTFLVRDVGAARVHLNAVGVGAVDVDGGTLLLDPSATLGARLLLTDAALPGDPR